MNIFKHAREVARSCTDEAKRVRLRARTDECKEAYDIFCASATREAMQGLTGAWCRLLIAIETVAPLPDDPTPAGRLTLPDTGAFDHDPDIHDVIQKLTNAA